MTKLTAALFDNSVTYNYGYLNCNTQTNRDKRDSLKQAHNHH